MEVLLFGVATVAIIALLGFVVIWGAMLLS
jgi:hypothetical protein